MLLSQIANAGGIAVVARENPQADARLMQGAESIHALASEAAARGIGLAALIGEKGLGDAVDLVTAYAEGRLLSPITHPDPAHLHLTGTGLTHLGSAATRDAMHKTVDAAAEEELTDSMKMFRMGLEGGKPAAGDAGVQPEW
ncbi:MAG TPA: GguC protein, partial [Pararhizobium sp.]|nr:GguC protein [Pararhizobium sp.]